MVTNTRKEKKTPAPELREAIVSAVATLDQSDGSRVSLIESIDNARRTLAEVMPDNFDDLVTEYLEAETDEYDEYEVDEDDEETEWTTREERYPTNGPGRGPHEQPRLARACAGVASKHPVRSHAQPVAIRGLGATAVTAARRAGSGRARRRPRPRGRVPRR